MGLGGKLGAAPSGLGVRQQLWERESSKGSHQDTKDSRKKYKAGLGHCIYFHWVFFRPFFKNSLLFLLLFFVVVLGFFLFIQEHVGELLLPHVHMRTQICLMMNPKTSKNKGKTQLPREVTVFQSHPLAFTAPSVLCHMCFPYFHTVQNDFWSGKKLIWL